jgi:hypothetical protein
MARHSPSKRGVNAFLTRPSTPKLAILKKDVDARDKPGHDQYNKAHAAE